MFENQKKKGMNTTMDSICPLDFRYGREEIKQLFREKQRLQYLLDVESALARAHASVGTIPIKDAEEITKKASIKYVSTDRVKEIERETKHDIMAVTKALVEVCDKDAGKYVHLGATSYDIVDTMWGLILKQALDVLEKDLILNIIS